MTHDVRSLELRPLHKDDRALMAFSSSTFQQRLEIIAVYHEVVVGSSGKNIASNWQEKPLLLFF